jgi:hydroxyacylglutathione hydrolase
MNRSFDNCYLMCIILLFLSNSCSTPGELFVVSETEGPIKTKCYLLYELPAREAAVFDAAGPLDSLTEIINENNLALKYIFVTHAHWDHVEGIFDLKEKFPEAKICLSNEEYLAMQDYTSYAKTSDPEQFEEFMQDSALARMINTDLGAIKPDIFLKDNEEYELGNSVIRSIFAPGHTAGSMCFSCNNFLFSGDVLFYRSVGNTDFYKGSRTDLIESVRKLYALFPDSTIVYPGHGRPTDIGSEKYENKYVTVDDGKWDAK